MPLYTPAQAAKILQIASSSIRNYTRNPLLSSFFSATATPEANKARQLTPDDLRVLKFIADGTAHGLTIDDVAQRLAAGELSAMDWQPPSEETDAQPGPGAGSQTAALVLASAYQQFAQREAELYERLLESERARAAAEAELAALRARLPWWVRLFGKR